MTDIDDTLQWTDNDTRVLQVLANVLAGQSRHDEAAVFLEYALRKEPRNTDVMKALCGVYLLLDRNEDALVMADAVLAEAPDQPDMEKLLHVRSQALWRCGRAEEARAEMQHYISKRRVS